MYEKVNYRPKTPISLKINFIITLILFVNFCLQYSAIELGRTGAGGEYNPQTGFGWTNGFLMEVFNTWGKFLKSSEIIS